MLIYNIASVSLFTCNNNATEGSISTPQKNALWLLKTNGDTEHPTYASPT